MYRKEDAPIPRDGAGNYNLPAGNPVVSGQTIESIWANTTMDDIAAAMTDSLSRSGNGGMLAPFLFSDGTAALPGAAWSLEPQTGFYRAATGDLRVSVQTQDIMRWHNNTASVWDTVNLTWREIAVIGGSGTVPDGMSDGQRLEWDETGGNGWVLVAAPLTLQPGSVDGTLLRWDQDDLQWAETQVLKVNDAGQVIVGNEIWVPNGSEGAPVWAFNNEQNTGWFTPGSGIMAWSLVGTEKMRLDADGLAVAGTVNTRDISADGDTLDAHVADLAIHVPTTKVGAAPAINNYVSITQTDYDLLAPPDPNTLYFVTPP